MLTPFVQSRLRCPECHAQPIDVEGASVVCTRCGSRFPVHDRVPALLRRDNDLFPLASYRQASSPRPTPRGVLTRLLPSPSSALDEREHLEAFARALHPFPDPQVLVVGSGRQRRALEARLAAHRSISLTFCDVDVRAEVDLFCDAHELPFSDASFQGLIATAVLEHVLYPERVVAQFHRVLCDEGVVYTEVPFLQQVHEGAYDFTRYTLSGHRRLLNGFQELASGMVAGPGTVLAWAIESFALAFARGRWSSLALRAGARLGGFWLKYFDRWLQGSPWAMDGASATYFLGRKLTDRTVSDGAIVARYEGGGRTRHL